MTRHLIRGWSFPRHRPQMHAKSSSVLRSLVPYYSFGRQHTTRSKRGLRAVLGLPVARRVVAGRHPLPLPMDRSTFDEILAAIARVVDQHEWGLFQSTWHSQRLIVFSLDRQGRCTAVTHVAPVGEVTFHPQASGSAVHVPAVLDTRTVGNWNLRIEASLPPWHEPHPWDVARLTSVASDIKSIVADQLGPRVGGDEGWVPIHGDMTPWNLRVDQTGITWLLDWEWASWGPPHADILRFAATYCSLSMSDPTEIASWIEGELNINPRAAAESASFWLDQRMYRELGSTPPDTSTAEGDERMTGWVEAAALRLIADRPR